MIDHEALRRAAAILAVADRLEKLLEQEPLGSEEALILETCIQRLRARIKKAPPCEGGAVLNDLSKNPRHGDL